MPRPPIEDLSLHHPPELERADSASNHAPASKRTWAQLLSRVYGIDALRCEACGARMRVVAAMPKASEVRRILEHLGLPHEVPTLEASHEWWLEHRDKAPSAFDEDFEEALTFIRENALLGPKVATTKRRVIRRVLMPRVGLHLYYHAVPRGLPIAKETEQYLDGSSPTTRRRAKRLRPESGEVVGTFG